LGVQGIHVPHVSSAAAARDLVAAARYTPLGERGLIGYSRAADYGRTPGPNDLAGALEVPGQPDHPKLVAAMDRIVTAVKKVSGPRLALPLGHPVYPRTVAECRELGVGLLLCGTAPEARLLRAMSQEVADVRRDIAGG
jgi:2-keto-3-deoxy-L-rhamnonate aldolase RhmA